MESLQLLSRFIFTHLSSLWFIVPLHSLSGVQCLHFLSLLHTYKHVHVHTLAFPDIFHFHLLWLFSYFSHRSPFFSPAVVEILDVLACLLSSPHHLWGGSRRVYRPESVCRGVKDPLSPKPSPVRPTESPDGVIQPSWSPANSYSHSHTQIHTLWKPLKEKVILSPLLSHHSEAALEGWQGEEVLRGSTVVINPQGKVTFTWLEASRRDTKTEEGTG